MEKEVFKNGVLFSNDGSLDYEWTDDNVVPLMEKLNSGAVSEEEKEEGAAGPRPHGDKPQKGGRATETPEGYKTY